MKQPDGSQVEEHSFAAVIQAFLASEKFQRLAKSTQTGYRRSLLLAGDRTTLGALSVMEIRPALIQQFIDGMAHIPGGQQCALVALKSLERWAVVRDKIRFPFTTGVEIIGAEGHHEPWTDDQVAFAEKYARPEIARAVTLGANTGQRGSDLVKMRWSEIETYGGRVGINVTQQKTGLKLWVPFTAELSAAIETWERRPGFILTRADGNRWPGRQSLTQAWCRERDHNRNLAGCAGLVLHGLRGYAVVRLRRAGLTPLQITDVVGMSVPMIERYCVLANKQQSALAAVLHLDQYRGIFPTRIFNKTGE